MISGKRRTFSADFETTVDEDTSTQTRTEVWSAASVELWTEDVMIFHSIGELFEYYLSLKENIVVYFHNLKFDGNFWLYYLLHDAGYKQSYDCQEGDIAHGKFRNNGQMQNKSFIQTAFSTSIRRIHPRHCMHQTLPAHFRKKQVKIYIFCRCRKEACLKLDMTVKKNNTTVISKR